MRIHVYIFIHMNINMYIYAHTLTRAPFAKASRADGAARGFLRPRMSLCRCPRVASSLPRAPSGLRGGRSCSPRTLTLDWGRGWGVGGDGKVDREVERAVSGWSCVRREANGVGSARILRWLSWPIYLGMGSCGRRGGAWPSKGRSREWDSSSRVLFLGD